MSEPIVRRKFSAASRSPVDIPGLDWMDWKWQLQHAKVQPEVPPRMERLVTPYADGFRKQFFVERSPTLQPEVGYYDFGLLNPQDIFLQTDEAIDQELHRQVQVSSVLNTFTGTLSSLPMRMTDSLLRILKQHPRLLIHANFQHPSQCTSEAFDACSALANAGVIINNRMTLMRDLNEDPMVVKELNHRLLMMRVRPYAIFNDRRLPHSIQVPKSRGVEILEQLRGWTSGIAVPHYIVLESNGETQLQLPNYVKAHEDLVYTFRNYRNDEYRYEES